MYVIKAKSPEELYFMSREMLADFCQSHGDYVLVQPKYWTVVQQLISCGFLQDEVKLLDDKKQPVNYGAAFAYIQIIDPEIRWRT